MKTIVKRSLMFAWERRWMTAPTVIFWIARLNLRNA